MLKQAQLFTDLKAAETALIAQLHNGQALAKLAEMVQAQGGNQNQIHHPESLPDSKFKTEIHSTQSGWIAAMHTTQLGHLAMVLGAGRATKEDAINPAVGFILARKTGEFVKIGDVLATIYHDGPLSESWISDFRAAYILKDQPVDKVPLIYDRL
jgi:pyrimidine-nucleoside phosphorylase